MASVQYRYVTRVELEADDVVLLAYPSIQLQSRDVEEKSVYPESVGDSCTIVYIVLNCSTKATLNSNVQLV